MVDAANLMRPYVERLREIGVKGNLSVEASCRTYRDGVDSQWSVFANGTSLSASTWEKVEKNARRFAAIQACDELEFVATSG